MRLLELSLDPEQEVLADAWWDDWPMRDVTEKIGIMFISGLIESYGPERLIKAGFVECWLAKQNWGVGEEERHRNFRNYTRNRLGDLIKSIEYSPAGRAALVRANLLPEDANLFDGSSSAPVVSGSRFVEQSVEEQRLRHRHREAMVLNDGTRPINSGDIIQRDISSSPI